MARHSSIERTETQDGTAPGLVVTICIVLLVGIVALFTLFGGPGRFIAGPAPPVPNVSVPVQSQSQGGPQVNAPDGSSR